MLSLFVIPFLLTGCFKFTMDLEVSSQDTISGTAVVALSKELQALAQGGGGEPTDAFADLEGVEVTAFDDGTFVGQQYEFSGLPIDDLALNDDSSALTIQRDGDNLIVSGSLSFEDEEADPEAAEDLGFGQAFFDSADLHVSIKFPGEIVETNGEVNEETNTITWRPKYGAANELNAVVYAPKGIPNWVWTVGLSLLGVAVLALGLILGSRRLKLRKPRQDPPFEDGVEPQGFPRGDRPLLRYQVRTSLFSREKFEVRLYNDEVLFGFATSTNGQVSDLVRIPISEIEHASTVDTQGAVGARIVTSGRVELIPGRRNDSSALVGAINSLFTSQANSPNSADLAATEGKKALVTPTKDASSLTKELREMHSLLSEGVISEEEFSEFKRKRLESS